MSKKNNRGYTESAARIATDDTPSPAGPPPQTPSLQLFFVNLKLIRIHITPVLVLLLLPASLGQLGTTLIGDDIFALKFDTATIVGFAIRFVASLWLLAGFAAVFYYSLRVIGGTKPTIWESYHNGFPYTIRLIITNLTVVITVAAGLLMLVFPAFIFLRRYFLSAFFAMDTNCDTRDAMIASSKASKPHKRAVWSMIGIMLVLMGLAAASSRYIPVFGPIVSSIISSLGVFLPALRYQEITSDVRAGEKALAPYIEADAQA